MALILAGWKRARKIKRRQPGLSLAIREIECALRCFCFKTGRGITNQQGRGDGLLSLDLWFRIGA
jgi:hypothetical protein